MMHIIQQLKRKWREFRLQWLIKRQEAIDAVLNEQERAYEDGLQEVRNVHEKITNRLAAKRTAIRSALIRG
ncbi:hypothetical protein [Collimonas antrihumi]|uniref:hypothetical protein n=1 Tax=Collimonas antrihumi TaxID=1940615 RepID=UPI001B8B4754|nr:hypothetical protein [Collimonas antrihumi]